MRAAACACQPRTVAVTLRNLRRRRSRIRERSVESEVLCLRCGRIWRTQAAYVDTSPDAPAGWEVVSLEEIRKALGVEIVDPTSRAV